MNALRWLAAHSPPREREAGEIVLPSPSPPQRRREMSLIEMRDEDICVAFCVTCAAEEEEEG